VRPYGKRFFAVYEDEVLLAVCAYRKGALAVQERLYGLHARISHLEEQQGASRPIVLEPAGSEDAPWSA